MDSFFESVSALTTTGITTGITSMDMNVVSKIFLIVNMIFGRFEIIAIVYLFIENKKIKTRGSEYLKHLHIPNKHPDKTVNSKPLEKWNNWFLLSKRFNLLLKYSTNFDIAMTQMAFVDANVIYALFNHKRILNRI